MADDFDSFDAPTDNGGGSTAFSASSLSAGAKQFIKQFMPDDDDSGCIGTFFIEREFQTFESKRQSDDAALRGEPPIEIFKDVLYVSIDIKGSNLNAVRRPATEADKKRFPFSWQEFQKGVKAREHGLPLAKLGLDGQTIREYASYNVFTIEDLSQVSDNNLQRMGVGSREWRLRAKDYLATHKAASESTRVIDDLKDAQRQQQEALALQSQQLAQLMAANERLMEENKKLSDKRGPGRPSKTDE